MDKARVDSFSFLTIENNPNLLGHITVGVIRYDGIVTNRHGGIDLGFVAEKKLLDGKHDNLVRISFDTKSKMSDKPVVILFPAWYTDAGIYPSGPGQASVALYGAAASKDFNVVLGAKGRLDRSYLGFNFAALHPDLHESSKGNFKFGYIKLVEGNIVDSKELYGSTVQI